MEELAAGIYETLITRNLSTRLEALDDLLSNRARALAPAEVPDRIALHLSSQIAQALSEVSEKDRVEVGARIVRQLVVQLGDILNLDQSLTLVEPVKLLSAILGRLPDGSTEQIESPLTPVLDTTLLTNAPGEPNLWAQLRSEIQSADRIDVIMAFIRRSGIGPLLGSLKQHCEAGRELRVLTTTYTGSTEQAALQQLVDLGAEVRVSYDLSGTRLHAKAWAFHRRSGFSTAYVGSSNLTHSAQVTGVEWNVRLSGARNRDALDKFDAVFSSYWSGGDYETFDPIRFADEQVRVKPGDTGPKVFLSPVEIRPFPYQDRLLELVALSRQRGYHRNLLVAATGTGKTVMAALDYARLRGELSRSRLLFIAHREEILDQSLATFRHALRDASFGEKWVGGERPSRYEHVFASIQSLNARGMESLDPQHFDVVIVDEFHHAAAASYEKVLKHLTPIELLGLTATPERSDGQPIIGWFDDRIAAELRLWDAIEQQHLSPFMYFGIYDGIDLSDVPWRRGSGYDVESLSGVYTSSDAWARLVIQELNDRVDVASMRALGFCVSVEHARFMARHFSDHGIPSVAIWGDSPWSERQAALDDLRSGEVSVVFSVDLFNEGVDLPNVNTILLLRPTESPVLFLQQLGRGLRKVQDKSHCTVLDFVGNHRQEFRFDRRYRALLGGTRRELEQAVKEQFPYLPAGCSMQLDQKSSDIVLRSIREAVPSRWKSKVDELASLRRERPGIGLAAYLNETGLELADIYANNRCWSDLLEAAGQTVLNRGPHEKELRRALGRLLHIDDSERIRAYRALVAPGAPKVALLDIREKRLVHMLAASLADGVVAKDSSLQAAVDLVWSHPQVLLELGELLGVLEQQIDHLHFALNEYPDVPLHVHARYTRLEILSSMGEATEGQAKLPQWREGVRQAKGYKAELLPFTLDKTGDRFSPTTRYRDYAISRTLIHWESQSATTEEGQTGLRYRNHEAEGRSILLFARVNKSDRAFWFLGSAKYRGHVGEKPMAVTWELDVPLPGDLFAAFAAAVP